MSSFVRDDVHAHGEPPNGLRYQVDDLKRRIADVERRTENVNVMAAAIEKLGKDLHDLEGEVSGLRRALYTAALSFVVGALILALSISQVLG